MYGFRHQGGPERAKGETRTGGDCRQAALEGFHSQAAWDSDLSLCRSLFKITSIC